MNEAGASRGRWAVSVRSSGEVLVAEAVFDDIHLLLIGIPEGFTQAEVSGWLSDVAGVARETSQSDTAAKPIPRLLHHALTGLIFSQAELWSRTAGAPPCSVALVRGADEVGLGWVGEAEVEVELDGALLDVQWVKVRDELGREARAWSIESGRSMRALIRWVDALGGVAEMDAQWQGASAARAEAPTLSVEIPRMPSRTADLESEQPALAHGAGEFAAEPLAGSAPPAGEEAGEAPSTGVARWLVNTVPWLRRSPRRAEPPLEPATETPASVEPPGPTEPVSTAEVPGGFAEAPRPLEFEIVSSKPVAPAPTPEHATPPRAVTPVASSAPEAVAPPHLAPAARGPQPTATDEGVPASFETIAAAPERLAPTPVAQVVTTTRPALPYERLSERALPEVVPPTPEPPAVTARAIPLPESGGPRTISLPSETSPVPPTAPPRPSAPPAAAPIVAPRPSAPPAAVPSAPVFASSVAPAPPVEPVAPPPPPIVPAPSATTTAPAGPATPAQPAPDRVGDRPGAAPAVHPSTPHGAELEPSHPLSTAPFRPEPAPYPQRAGAWPAPETLAEQDEPIWKRPWAWAAAIVLVIAGVWIMAPKREAPRPGAGQVAGPSRSLVGWGGPRFKAVIESQPAGAHIRVDGQPIEAMTPATVEMPPGPHQVTLSLAELGEATFNVNGAKGEEVPLKASLTGSLEVISPDPSAVISVTVDGVTRGFAPLTLDGLEPGAHDVRFSGPGIASWGQTIQVRIGETRQILARAMESPATGLINVRATAPDEDGTGPVSGGQVWVDGELKGGAPLTLELARGPHSIRMVYRGVEAPIQVIDLPGGNQRFATFDFGGSGDREMPRIVLSEPNPRIARDRPTMISAALVGARPGEVREMWLHVRSPDGSWRRYEMTLLNAQGTLTGVAPFPIPLLDAQGRGRYYVSALTTQGDEYYTELEPVQAAGK